MCCAGWVCALQVCRIRNGVLVSNRATNTYGHIYIHVYAYLVQYMYMYVAKRINVSIYMNVHKNCSRSDVMIMAGIPWLQKLIL